MIYDDSIMRKIQDIPNHLNIYLYLREHNIDDIDLSIYFFYIKSGCNSESIFIAIFKDIFISATYQISR